MAGELTPSIGERVDELNDLINDLGLALDQCLWILDGTDGKTDADWLILDRAWNPLKRWMKGRNDVPQLIHEKLVDFLARNGRDASLVYPLSRKLFERGEGKVHPNLDVGKGRFRNLVLHLLDFLHASS